MQFSIVIPAIKAQYLRQAIKSVLVQSVNDYELLVLDDCSPHNLGLVVEKMADARIGYFKTPENLGAKDPSRTWNYALGLVKGDIIILLGDDDELAPNYLEEMQCLTGNHPSASIYRARLRLINPVGGVFEYGWSLPELETWDEFLYFRQNHGRLHSTSEMAVRTKALRDMGGYISMPLALGSDDLTWMELALEHPIVSTNKTYACWRRHQESISSAVWAENHQAKYLAGLYSKIEEFLKKNEPPSLDREVLVNLIQERIKQTTDNLSVPQKESSNWLKQVVRELAPPVLTRILRRGWRKFQRQS